MLPYTPPVEAVDPAMGVLAKTVEPDNTHTVDPGRYSDRSVRQAEKA